MPPGVSPKKLAEPNHGLSLYEAAMAAAANDTAEPCCQWCSSVRGTRIHIEHHGKPFCKSKRRPPTELEAQRLPELHRYAEWREAASVSSITEGRVRACATCFELLVPEQQAFLFVEAPEFVPLSYCDVA